MKFTTIFQAIVWILLVAFAVLTISSAFFCIQQTQSNWNVSSDWAIGNDWNVASTTISKPLPVSGLSDLLSQILESLKKESNLIFPFSLVPLIVTLIIKHRDRIIR